LLNKSENERSGVLSTAMSFLGLYRDPVIAHVTRRCDWRIADLIDGERPTSLYLVIPPSDISRTKPLTRLILNQIGRRLTEELYPEGNRHRVLLMLDEFPALGRLDFFESALAFMAGYGLKAFLIAQSLNQIEKAYGQNNAILDNCHVRVAFATNDNETAKRVSESLGTATEMRAMKNYAGHRLSPWLGHLMVSRSETSRPLLTQGEILQLPETDEVVMIGGTPPIRAKKAQYYIDRRLMKRILPPPTPTVLAIEDVPHDDWTGLILPRLIEVKPPEAPIEAREESTDPANAGIRREPELPQHEEIIPQPPTPQNEFHFDRDDTADDEATRNQRIQERMRGALRQASLDPGDGIAL
jgi:type IV secretion system protein VirD4